MKVLIEQMREQVQNVEWSTSRPERENCSLSEEGAQRQGAPS